MLGIGFMLVILGYIAWILIAEELRKARQRRQPCEMVKTAPGFDGEGVQWNCLKRPTVASYLPNPKKRRADGTLEEIRCCAGCAAALRKEDEGFEVINDKGFLR